MDFELSFLKKAIKQNEQYQKKKKSKIILMKNSLKL